MDPEEAAAATHLFVTFCKLAGIDNKSQVYLLEKDLDIWKERTSIIEKTAIMRQMQEEIGKLRSLNKDLLKQKEEYEKLLRNLVYVGITRAMDNLNVFTTDNDDPILKNLICSFNTM